MSGLARDERSAVAAALRARIPITTSTVGVVIDSDIQARREAPAALGSLQRACSRRRSLVRDAKEPLANSLVALADADAEPLLPWLPLAEGDLLVVPRLGARARRAAFEREVTSALATARSGRVACPPG